MFGTGGLESLLKGPHDDEDSLYDKRTMLLSTLRIQVQNAPHTLDSYFKTGKFVTTLVTLVNYCAKEDMQEERWDLRQYFPEYSIEMLDQYYNGLISKNDPTRLKMALEFRNQFFAMPNSLDIMANAIRKGSSFMIHSACVFMASMVLTQDFVRLNVPNGDAHLKKLVNHTPLLDAIFSVYEREDTFVAKQLSDFRFHFLYDNLLKIQKVGNSKLHQEQVNNYAPRVAHLIYHHAGRLLSGLVLHAHGNKELEDAIVFHPSFVKSFHRMMNEVAPLEYIESTAMLEALQMIGTVLPCPFFNQAQVKERFFQLFYFKEGQSVILKTILEELEALQILGSQTGIGIKLAYQQCLVQFEESRKFSLETCAAMLQAKKHWCIALLAYCSEYPELCQLIKNYKNGYVLSVVENSLNQKQTTDLSDMMRWNSVMTNGFETEDWIIGEKKFYDGTWHIKNALPPNFLCSIILFENLSKQTESFVTLRYQVSEAMKNLINTQWFPKRFDICIQGYNFAVRVLESLHSTEANHKKSIYIANRALCEMKLNQPKQALQSIIIALELNPNYEKAIQRKKQIEEMLKD